MNGGRVSYLSICDKYASANSRHFTMERPVCTRARVCTDGRCGQGHMWSAFYNRIDPYVQERASVRTRHSQKMRIGNDMWLWAAETLIESTRMCKSACRYGRGFSRNMRIGNIMWRWDAETLYYRMQRGVALDCKEQEERSHVLHDACT